MEDLARRLGVSHIPVREGIYGLRLLIEPELAARSARKHSPEQLDRLARLLEDSADRDPEKAWRGHQEFHPALVEPAASAWDMSTLERLWSAAQRYTRLVFDPADITEEERQRRKGIHAGILERVTDRDTRGVRRVLRDQLRSNEAEMVDRIGRLEATGADRASG